MFKIGEFSKLAQVSIGTLRYYDHIGLLSPVEVDNFTGYRYYSASQLPRLHRILALKGLGFSLDEIEAVLARDLTAEQIREMLDVRRAQICQQLEDLQNQLCEVELRLSTHPTLSASHMTTITTQPIIEERPAQHHVSIRSQVAMKDMPEVILQHINEVAAWLGQQNVEPDGAPIIRYYACPAAADSAIVDMAVGFLVGRVLSGNERILADTLPAGRYASLIYIGVENGIPGNAALIEWANNQGIQWDSWENTIGEAFAGRIEHLIDGPDDDPNPSNWKTEVAIKLVE
jgi:DNA-binding transcriptional MerR regulator